MDPERVAHDRLAREGVQGIYRWSNGPGDTYGEHSHPFTKVLICARGSIDFHLADGSARALRAGDRMELAPGTQHSAVVGPQGCICVEGKR